LLGAYYDIKILFNVSPGVFNPPPKVESAVIRMQLKTGFVLPCDGNLLTKVVKQGFQNRRKTLRNALKPINLPESLLNDPILDKRAEQLSVNEFFSLTNKIEEHWNH
jgi:16S rRNA (adenine1518-N6/adenine1519-N6)-dimethyltransferase